MRVMVKVVMVLTVMEKIIVIAVLVTALVGNDGDDCGEYVNSGGMMVMVVMRMVEMSTVWAMMAIYLHLHILPFNHLILDQCAFKLRRVCRINNQ